MSVAFSNYFMALVAIAALLVMAFAWHRRWYVVAGLFAAAVAGYWFGVLFDSLLLALGGYGALCAGLYAFSEKTYFEFWL